MNERIMSADSESVVKRRLEWCLNKGKTKGTSRIKHRGVRRIKPDFKESDAHVKKALYNLKAMTNFRNDYPDWSASAAFYAMYHALLAVLYALGYESRNQECSITVLEHAAGTGRLSLEPEYVEMIRSTKKHGIEGAKSLREDYQYGTKTRVRKDLLERTHKNAYKFVEKMRILQQQLKQD